MSILAELPELDNVDRFDLGSVPAKNVPTPRTPAEPRYRRVEIGGFSRPIVIALLVVLFCASVGDFINAKTVFDLVFTNSASYNAWALAISLTALAIIATHVAGYLWREAHGLRGLKVLATLVITAWLGAGALLAILRVAVGSESGSASASSQPGTPFAGLHIATGVSPHPAVVAAVLAAIWVTTGLVSFSIGYLAHAPAGDALSRLEATSDKESRRLGEARGEERHAAHTLEAQRLHRSRLAEAWRQANAAADARRDELRAWARLELVRVLGDPAATNDILPRPASDPTTKE